MRRCAERLSRHPLLGTESYGQSLTVSVHLLADSNECRPLVRRGACPDEQIDLVVNSELLTRRYSIVAPVTIDIRVLSEVLHSVAENL